MGKIGNGFVNLHKKKILNLIIKRKLNENQKQGLRIILKQSLRTRLIEKQNLKLR
jgi:hypothetical protein